MLVVLGAVRSSPGTTTAALLVAGSAESAVLVEADPDGGVLQARFGLAREPNLATFAAAARAGTPPDVTDHTQMLPGGLPVVTSPASADAAVATWHGAGPAVSKALRAVAAERMVIVDAGRFTPTSPHSALLDTADAVVLVIRPVLEDLNALAHRRDALLERAGDLRLLVIGDQPYGASEIQHRLELPVLGVLPSDPRSAGAFAGTKALASSRWLRRSPLTRAVRAVVENLVAGSTEPSPTGVPA